MQQVIEDKHSYREFSCDVISRQFSKVVILVTTMLVSFFAQPCIGKYNKMFCYFLFTPDYNIKLQLGDKNISKYTHSLEILNPGMKEIKSYVLHVLLFSLFRAVQRENQEGMA